MAGTKGRSRAEGRWIGGAVAASIAAAGIAGAWMSAPHAASAQAVSAAPSDGPAPVTASAAAVPGSVKRSGKGVMNITITVSPEYHIYAPKPGDEYAIPTTLKFTSVPGIKLGEPKFPAAKSLPQPGAKPINVFMGKIVVAVPFTVAPSAKPGKAVLKADLTYQSCNATSCLPPKTDSLSATVTVL